MDSKLRESGQIVRILISAEFCSRARMYKSRVSQWHLWKYQVTRKKRAVEAVGLDDRNKKRARTIMNEQNPVSPGVSCKVCAELLQDPNSDLHEDSISEKQAWNTLGCFDAWRPVPVPFDAESIEAMFQYTQDYVHWALSQRVDVEAAEPLQFAYNLQDLRGQPQALDGAIPTRKSIWYKFHFGVGLLERQRYEQAFHVLDAGCSSVRRFLKEPTRLLFQSLYMVLGSERWKQFSSIQVHLLKFLGDMASIMLGVRHPITLLLVQLSKDSMFERTAEMMLRSTLDTFEGALGQGQPEVLRLQRTLCTALQRQKNYQPCEEILRKACRHSEHMNGSDDVETRRCLRRLGYLYMEQGRYEETVRTCEDVISRQTELNEGALPDEFTICTYQNLAVATECLGQHEKSENWLLLSVDGARRKWGLHGAFSFEDFDGLKEMLWLENNNQRHCLEDAAHHQGLLRKIRIRILGRQKLPQECEDCGEEKCSSHSHLARITENRF